MRSISFVGVAAALISGLLSGPAWATDVGAAKLGRKLPTSRWPIAPEPPSTTSRARRPSSLSSCRLSARSPPATPPSWPIWRNRYAQRSIAFLRVLHSDEETAESVAKKAAEYKLGFPVYKDDKGAAVEALKAEITPEAFVLDHNFVLRYRGRIDDGYSARLKKNRKSPATTCRTPSGRPAGRQAGQHAVAEAVGCPIDVERVSRTAR